MNIHKINLGKLVHQLGNYENKWIAISQANVIVSSGRTYTDTLKKARNKGEEEVVLFKVPPLNYSLAP